jgi:transcriptional regulator PpsR
VKPFSFPKVSLGDLDAASAAALIAAAADIALVLDGAGVIRDMAVQSDEFATELTGGEDWIGRTLQSTVAPDSRTKSEAMLREAATTAAPKWRHINHGESSNGSVPVLYSALQTGVDGRVMVFGRDMRAMSVLQQRLVSAQQSMERDYSKLRDVEMRYRLLFQMSSEAVLILDVGKLKVVEANPAARQLLGARGDTSVGHSLLDLLDQGSVATVQAHLAAVRAGTRADSVRVTLVEEAAQGEAAEVILAASLFRQDSTTFFLVRLLPANLGRFTAAVPDAKTKLLKMVESAPDGFVVTHHDGLILTANAAFLEMAQLASEEQARGEHLDRWVGESSVDLNVLMSNLRQHGTVRFFTTSLRGEFGATAQIEISAVQVTNGGQPCFGFAIRNVAPRLRSESRPGRELPRSVQQLTELIGRVALKDLVREATDVIERMCIEAALELTGDNRASAAEMLGLSRQSLYVKLRRYGLGDLGADGRD